MKCRQAFLKCIRSTVYAAAHFGIEAWCVWGLVWMGRNCAIEFTAAVRSNECNCDSLAQFYRRSCYLSTWRCRQQSRLQQTHLSNEWRMTRFRQSTTPKNWNMKAAMATQWPGYALCSFWRHYIRLIFRLLLILFEWEAIRARGGENPSCPTSGQPVGTNVDVRCTSDEKNEIFTHNPACSPWVAWKLWKHNASVREMAEGKFTRVRLKMENQINRFYCFGLFILVPCSSRTHTHTWSLWSSMSMCIAIDVTLSHFSRASIIQGDYICK